MRQMVKPIYIAVAVAVVVLFLVAHQLQLASARRIGVCYGLNGDNLPPPPEVISLYKQLQIELVRIYEPRQDVFQALRGSGLAVAVGPRNEDLEALAASRDSADKWVNDNLVPYKNDVKFRWITVGNEVIPGPLAVHVPGAMSNLYDAIVEAGIPTAKVTTAAHGLTLGAAYPPSAGAFVSEATDIMTEVAAILRRTGGSLMVNVYPYYAYVSDPAHISLEYATFGLGAPREHDGELVYSNLYDANLDAFYAAMEKIGYGDVPLTVGETGWPSAGNGKHTTPDLARTYNQNLLNHALANGTPRRPDRLVDTFLFAMFNENLKSQGIEQNFGLFYPDKHPVYPIIWN